MSSCLASSTSRPASPTRFASPTATPASRTGCKTAEPVRQSYKVTGQILGTGMSGNVEMAESIETGAKFAMRSFDLGAMTEEGRADIAQEIQVHSSLDHPNVARLVDACSTHNKISLMVEYLAGGDVYGHIIEEEIYNERYVIGVVRQLLSAVEHLHERGVVHRDIKPENIMYCDLSREDVKLIDFGLSTFWKDGDAPMTRACGTEGYMAPEVLKGKGYTNMADMWSIGVLTHVLLTHDIVGRHRDYTPHMSSRMGDCSTEAQKFVAALLTVDPNIRLSATQALQHPWLTSGQEKWYSGRPRAESGFTYSTAVPPSEQENLDVEEAREEDEDEEEVEQHESEETDMSALCSDGFGTLIPDDLYSFDQVATVLHGAYWSEDIHSAGQSSKPNVSEPQQEKKSPQRSESRHSTAQSSKPNVSEPHQQEKKAPQRSESHHSTGQSSKPNVSEPQQQEKKSPQSSERNHSTDKCYDVLELQQEMKSPQRSESRHSTGKSSKPCSALKQSEQQQSALKTKKKLQWREKLISPCGSAESQQKDNFHSVGPSPSPDLSVLQQKKAQWLEPAEDRTADGSDPSLLEEKKKAFWKNMMPIDFGMGKKVSAMVASARGSRATSRVTPETQVLPSTDADSSQSSK